MTLLCSKPGCEFRAIGTDWFTEEKSCALSLVSILRMDSAAAWPRSKVR